MKLLLLFTILFSTICKAQSIAYSKDSSVWIVSYAPNIKISYIGTPDTMYDAGGEYNPNKIKGVVFHDSVSVVKEKYDTIGPLWRIVSDTAKDHWNPVSAVQVYEVRKYSNEWITVDPNVRTEVSPGVYSSTLMVSREESVLIPHHYKWLDSKKKTLNLAVWSAKIE